MSLSAFAGMCVLLVGGFVCFGEDERRIGAAMFVLAAAVAIFA